MLAVMPAGQRRRRAGTSECLQQGGKAGEVLFRGMSVYLVVPLVTPKQAASSAAIGEKGVARCIAKQRTCLGRQNRGRRSVPIP